MNLVPKIQMSPDGPSFSRLVQGYWRMAQWGMNSQQHLAFIKQHIEFGITTVDHAPVYGDPSCESLFGKALKLEPSLRDSIEIISKCGIYLSSGDSSGHVSHYKTSAQAIMGSVDESLSRLGVNYLDVLLIHRQDYLMDADVVARSFEELQRSGKVKYFGVSNFSPSQFSLLQSRCPQPLVTNQVEINPLNFSVLDDGTLDQLQQARVHPMAWSCLAGGRLFNGDSEQVLRLRKTLTEIAHEIGAQTLDQVIYAWILKIPSQPAVILGSGNHQRMASAVASLELSLDNEQWYRIWQASKGHPVP